MFLRIGCCGRAGKASPGNVHSVGASLSGCRAFKLKPNRDSVESSSRDQLESASLSAFASNAIEKGRVPVRPWVPPAPQALPDRRQSRADGSISKRICAWSCHQLDPMANLVSFPGFQWRETNTGVKWLETGPVGALVKKNSHIF